MKTRINKEEVMKQRLIRTGSLLLSRLINKKDQNKSKSDRLHLHDGCIYLLKQIYLHLHANWDKPICWMEIGIIKQETANGSCTLPETCHYTLQPFFKCAQNVKSSL